MYLDKEIIKLFTAAGLDKVEVQTQTITVETVEQYVQTMEQHVQPRSSAQQQGVLRLNNNPSHTNKLLVYKCNSWHMLQKVHECIVLKC